MSAISTKGAKESLPQAQISYDRYHVVALVNKATDEARRAEWLGEAQQLEQALGELTPAERRSVMFGIRRNPSSRSVLQARTMHWLQRANLKSWRLKVGLREVFAHARRHNDMQQPTRDLKSWISWAGHSRLEPFKRLGATGLAAYHP